MGDLKIAGEAVWLKSYTLPEDEFHAWWPAVHFRSYDEAAESYRLFLIMAGIRPEVYAPYGIVVPLHEPHLIAALETAGNICPFKENLNRFLIQTLEKTAMEKLRNSITDMCENLLPFISSSSSGNVSINSPLSRTASATNHPVKKNKFISSVYESSNSEPGSFVASTVREKLISLPLVTPESKVSSSRKDVGKAKISSLNDWKSDFSKKWNTLRNFGWTWCYGALDSLYLRPGVTQSTLKNFQENIHYFTRDSLERYLEKTWETEEWKLSAENCSEAQNMDLSPDKSENALMTRGKRHKQKASASKVLCEKSKKRKIGTVTPEIVKKKRSKDPYLAVSPMSIKPVPIEVRTFTSQWLEMQDYGWTWDYFKFNQIYMRPGVIKKDLKKFKENFDYFIGDKELKEYLEIAWITDEWKNRAQELNHEEKESKNFPDSPCDSIGSDTVGQQVDLADSNGFEIDSIENGFESESPKEFSMASQRINDELNRFEF